jgi:hypothetical protein
MRWLAGYARSVPEMDFAVGGRRFGPREGYVRSFPPGHSGKNRIFFIPTRYLIVVTGIEPGTAYHAFSSV